MPRATRLAALAAIAACCAVSTVAQHEEGDEHHHHLKCDRPRAREARDIIRTEVVALATKLGVELSRECPLHSDHDHVLGHEHHKSAISMFQWKCGYCGKLFRSERYLDMHLERKHSDLLPKNASVCLGDFCDILRCRSWVAEVQAQRHLPEYAHAHHQQGEASGTAPRCKEHRALDARRHFCQHLMHDCFTGADVSHAVFEAFDETFCAQINCGWRQRLRDGLEMGGRAAGDESGRGWRLVLGGFVLVSMVLLYIGLCCWVSETSVENTHLRARPGRSRGVWAAVFGSSKDKRF